MVYHCSHFHSGVADLCHKLPQSPFSRLESLFLWSLTQKLTHHTVHTTNDCGIICHPHVDSTHILSLTKFSWRTKIKPEVEEHSREPGVVKGSQHRFRQGRLISTKPPQALWRYYCSDRSEKYRACPPFSFSKSIWKKNLHQRLMARNPRLEVKTGQWVQKQHRSRRQEQEYHGTFAQQLPTEHSPHPSPGVSPSPPWNAAELRHLQNQQRTAFTGNCWLILSDWN